MAITSRGPATGVLTPLELQIMQVLWDTGHDSSRNPPYALSPELQTMMKNLAPFPRQ